MRLIYKITIPVVLVLGALMYLVSFVFSASLQNVMIRQEFLSVQDAVNKNQNRILTQDDFRDPTSAASQADFENFFEAVTSPSIARFTIWDARQTVIFSDLTSIVGSHLDGVSDPWTAFTNESAFYVLKSSDTGPVKQTNIPNYIDIFVPLHVSGAVVGVAEVRSVIGAITKPIEQQSQNILLSLAAALIIICGAVVLAFRLFVTAPLGVLKAVSTKVIQGDLTARGKVETKDELGEMTQFINAMLDRVEQSQKDLQAANATILKQKEGVEEEVRVRTRQLTEEEARLIASLNSLSLGFSIAEKDGKTIYVNPAVKRIFGAEGDITVNDIAGKLKDAIDFVGECGKAMEKKELIEFKEVPYETRFLRIIIAPITVAQSDIVIGSVAVFEDITEAKLLDYAKTSFVAIASHELRTPLTIIRGNAELILEDLKDKGEGELADRVKSIYEGSIRLLNIVNDFLDVTALEEKHVQFKEDHFDVIEVAESVAKDLHDRAAKKNLILEVVRPEGAIPKVIADRERTKEVFVNLLANAIQYTEKGGAKILFEAKDGFVKASVKDSGVGIPVEKQATLFKKFNTIQDKFLRSREYGSGMGLYIAKLIMESMSGRVALEASVPGEGTTFSVSFRSE